MNRFKIFIKKEERKGKRKCVQYDGYRTIYLNNTIEKMAADDSKEKVDNN